MEDLISDNIYNFEMCKRYAYRFILIEEIYCFDIELVVNEVFI